MAGRIKDKVEFYIKLEEDKLEQLENYWIKLVEEIYLPINMEEEIQENEFFLSLNGRKFILSERFIRKDMPKRNIEFKKRQMKDYEEQISHTENCIDMFKEVLYKASS